MLGETDCSRGFRVLCLTMFFASLMTGCQDPPASNLPPELNATSGAAINLAECCQISCTPGCGSGGAACYVCPDKDYNCLIDGRPSHIDQCNGTASPGGCGYVLRPACYCSESGQTLCGDICVDTLRNAANCGGCGYRCQDGQTCQNGSCVTPGPAPCDNGYTRCGGQCVDTTQAENNCGRCGNVCASGSTCRNSQCVPPAPTCNSPSRMCNAVCIDTSHDERNCGNCGATCPSSQVCRSSSCQCASGTTACGTGSQTVCCGSGQACQSGQCVTPSVCQAPRKVCNGVCTNIAGDANNCGYCGIKCDTGWTCASSVCIPPA